MNIHVIIAAAGESRRFGKTDKLSQDLGGRAVLLRSVEIFAKRDEVRGILVTAPPSELDAFRDRYAATMSFHGARIVAGGVTDRWESVRNALAEVPDDATHVAVHDAARPGIGDELLDRVFEAAASMNAVVPALPVDCTVKRTSGEAVEIVDDDAIADAIFGEAGRATIAARPVVETVDRAGLELVQTPQVFTVDLLRRAYAQDDLTGATDDASLVERLGETVYLVDGDPLNFKITVPADLKLMRAALGVKPPAERPVHKRF